MTRVPPPSILSFCCIGPNINLLFENYISNGGGGIISADNAPVYSHDIFFKNGRSTGRTPAPTVSDASWVVCSIVARLARFYKTVYSVSLELVSLFEPDVTCFTTSKEILSQNEWKASPTILKAILNENHSEASQTLLPSHNVIMRS